MMKLKTVVVLLFLVFPSIVLAQWRTENYTDSATNCATYDSTDPLNLEGDGVSGLGTYGPLGDRVGSDSNDDQFRPYFWINTSNINKTCGKTPYAANFTIYEYGGTGTKYDALVSLVNETELDVDATDHNKTAVFHEFATLSTSSGTGSYTTNITSLLDYAFKNSVFYSGFRLSPSAYEDDGANDLVYIHSSDDEFPPSITYLCDSTTTSTSTSSTTTSLTVESHPRALFNSISDAVGFDKQSYSPWSTFLTAIQAGSQPNYRAYDFLLTNNAADLTNVTNTLLNAVAQGGESYIDNCEDLSRECLAYDAIQDNLSNDNDTDIRYVLSVKVDEIYDWMDAAPGTAVRFVDEHMVCYSAIAICGYSLHNISYSNITTNAEDWRAMGTSMMFVNDTIHEECPYGLAECGIYENGRGIGGGYRDYYQEVFVNWMNVYNYTTGRQLGDDYPLAKRWITNDMWYTLPTGYNPQFLTDGHVKHGAINSMYSLLAPGVNRNNLYALYERVNADSNLPNTRSWNDKDEGTMFITYPNMSLSSQTWPTATTNIDSTNAPTYNIRQDWTENSTWITFQIWNETTSSNRDANPPHSPQLAFDYAAYGDNPIADSGEVKGGPSPQVGSADPYGHNMLLISNGSDGVAAGAFRTLSQYVIQHVAYKNNFLIKENFDFIEGRIDITETVRSDPVSNIGGNHSAAQETAGRRYFDDTLKHTRMILHPTDYFLVIERVNNSVSRLFEEMLHLSSIWLDGDSSSNGYQGNVSGDLTVEGSVIDWKNQAWGSKVNVANGSEIRWNTSSAYAGDIQTHIYNVPTGDISVRKWWIRAGGYDDASEVNHPAVTVGNTSSSAYYGILAFYTRPVSDSTWIYTPLTVTTASGEALRIVNGSFEDTVGNTNGVLGSFGDVTTDATVSFTRNTSTTDIDYFWGRNISRHNFTSTEMLTANTTLDYAYVERINTTKTNWTAKGLGTCNLKLGGLSAYTWYAYYDNGTLIPTFSDSTEVTLNITFASEMGGYVLGASSTTTSSTTTSSTTTSSTTTSSTTSSTTTSSTTTTSIPSNETIIYSGVNFYVGSGVYTVGQSTIYSNMLTVNTSSLSFSGLAAGSDCILNTTGIVALSSTTCSINSITGAQTLWINDTLLGSTAGTVTIINLTGNSDQTNMTLTYNHSGYANITLTLNNLDGDCNYGVFNYTTTNHTIIFVTFPYSNTSLTDCSLTLQTINTSTGVGGVSVRIYEDTSTSDSNLGTLIVALAVATGLITAAYRWENG